MKILLLFMVTIMIFFLYLIPIIWDFSSKILPSDASVAGYFFWYFMVFILTLCWGDIVKKNGCWFFGKH